MLPLRTQRPDTSIRPVEIPSLQSHCIRFRLLDSTYSAEPDRYQNQYHHHVVTYSSETGSWKASGEPFAVNYNKNDSGVYWNGAVHWFNRHSREGDSQYYNVNEERMGVMPVRPEPELQVRNCYGRESRHCGESGGHLYLVDTYDYSYMNRRVDVYEMARDYSIWLVKHRVDDLHGVIGIPRHRWASGLVSVLCVLRLTERDEEEEFMVLHLRGKLLGYCLANGNCKVICDLAAADGFDDEDMVRYFWSDCYPFVESLSRV